MNPVWMSGAGTGICLARNVRTGRGGCRALLLAVIDHLSEAAGLGLRLILANATDVPGPARREFTCWRVSRSSLRKCASNQPRRSRDGGTGQSAKPARLDRPLAV